MKDSPINPVFKMFSQYILVILGVFFLLAFFLFALPNIGDIQIDAEQGSKICKTNINKCELILIATLILLPLGFIFTLTGLANAIGLKPKYYFNRWGFTQVEILDITTSNRFKSTDSIDILIKGLEAQEEKDY